jgi:hypothetical protein
MSKEKYKIGDIVYDKKTAGKGELRKIRIDAILETEIKEDAVVIEELELSENTNWITNIIRLFFHKQGEKIEIKKSKTKKKKIYFSSDATPTTYLFPPSVYYDYVGARDHHIIELGMLNKEDICTKEEAEKIICEYWEERKKETLKEIDCKINKYCKDGKNE